MKFNKQEYLDKLYACWIGKNIGGTLADLLKEPMIFWI
jgi:hypothetical protein